ncbi:9684_t:CDS:1, partial [Gigaspora rosea]
QQRLITMPKTEDKITKVTEKHSNYDDKQRYNKTTSYVTAPKAKHSNKILSNSSSTKATIPK